MIKAYRPHNGFLPVAAQDALGLPNHVQQGGIYVAATSLREALEFAVPARLDAAKSNYRVAHGNHLDHMRAAGLLTAVGEIVVIRTHTVVGSPIVRYNHVAGTWDVAGEFVGDRRMGWISGVTLT